LPSIDRLADGYRVRGLEVVLVNIGEPEDHVRATVKNRGYRARVGSTRTPT